MAVCYFPHVKWRKQISDYEPVVARSAYEHFPTVLKVCYIRTETQNDNIKLAFREICREDIKCIQLPLDNVQTQASVNTITKLRFM
jgi:hypothetical protein